MGDYRCYFVDADGHFRGVTEFKSQTDAVAIVTAKCLAMTQNVYQRVELWEGSHLIAAFD